MSFRGLGSNERRGSLPAQAQRGGLIVLEGLDRSGKSTQVDRVVEHLKGRGVHCSKMAFPDRSTVIGGMIDSYLKGGQELDDAAIHLLFSANRWEKCAYIKEKIANGETLILDRYCFSGVAFTAAKGTHTLEWCKGPDRGLPRPDCAIYLDVSAETAASRGGFGDEKYEKEEFQMKVREQFDYLRHEDPSMWEIIDADRGVEELTEMIAEIAVQKMIKNMMLPLEDLWMEKPAGLGGFSVPPVSEGVFDGFGRTPS
uniref:Thymidylate kinase n=1 Tax=Hemiselmis andersenii TaxID=464988 RepID=A0A6U2GKX6_HEMAN|mmetsp:Transcript_36914/g.86505  ORF Transcript_36914/g.86505 Transcript_36914/m.86505 type:complete len:256 (+) Transcript_36914:50-817(+)